MATDAWKDMIRTSDAGHISPEAAEELITKAGEGKEARPSLPPAPIPAFLSPAPEVDEA